MAPQILGISAKEPLGRRRKRNFQRIQWGVDAQECFTESDEASNVQ
jgi:hypothetical protein